MPTSNTQIISTPYDIQAITRYFPRDIHLEIFDRIDSTNSYLKRLSGDAISICLAEQQTSGRGRSGQNWHSPSGANIYLSCRYPLQRKMAELEGLSLVVGLAVVRALSDYGIAKLFLKWPNDILWCQQKLAGILLETAPKNGDMTHVVIGIGININMVDAKPLDIMQPWTSLKKITGNNHDRNPIVGLIIKYLLDYIAIFDNKGFSNFTEEWQPYDDLYGKFLELQNNKQYIHGICQGIDARGRLLLCDENQEIHAFSSGEARIVKRSRA